MKRSTRLLAIGALSLPLAAGAAVATGVTWGAPPAAHAVTHQAAARTVTEADLEGFYYHGGQGG